MCATGATKVEVRLRNYGLELIEVIDNGSGIDKGDYDYVVRMPCYYMELAIIRELILFVGVRLSSTLLPNFAASMTCST